MKTSYTAIIATSWIYCVAGELSVDLMVEDAMSEWNGIGLTAWSTDEEGHVCTLGVSGERIKGSDKPLTTTGSSRHHVGSVTKSMTSTLLAILIEEGSVPDGWNATMASLMPFANGTVFANVTLQQLVSMSSGLISQPEDFSVFPPFDPNDVRSVRRSAAMAAVVSEPAHPIGTSFLYSNWAYVVAGHIIEELTNLTWEQALASKLFLPLGVDLGSDPRGFTGPPINDFDPWGHRGDEQEPCDPSQYPCDNDLALVGPAGTFSGPVGAMARYLSWHVACHNGMDSPQGGGLLSQESCQFLHQPADPQVSAYGHGWVCYDHPDYGKICNHNGSNLLHYYNATLAFDLGRAYVGYTNGADRTGELDGLMVNEVVGQLMESGEERCEETFALSKAVQTTSGSMITKIMWAFLVVGAPWLV